MPRELPRRARPFILSRASWLLPSLCAVPSGAQALPLAMDGFVGYESWSIASGNGNSVKPGDPSGFSLGVLARTHYWRGRKLFFLVDGGLRLLHATSERSAPEIRVTSELDAVFLGTGAGLGVEVNRTWTFEGLVNFDYALYSRFQYHASIEGYIPIRGDASLARLYRLGMVLRAFHRVVPDGLVGLEFAPYTGSYVWANPGTFETQRDSFSALSFRIVYRHFFNDARPAVKKPDKGRQVGEGIWVKSDVTDGSVRTPSAAKPPRVTPAPRRPAAGRPPPSRPGRLRAPPKRPTGSPTP